MQIEWDNRDRAISKSTGRIIAKLEYGDSCVIVVAAKGLENRLPLTEWKDKASAQKAVEKEVHTWYPQ